MNLKKSLSSFAISLLLMLGANAAIASPKWCSDKPVKFAGITWESGQFFTEVARIIVENGYDCKTEIVLGNSPVTEAALIANELQVWVETWGSELLRQGRNQGKINLLGNMLVGGTVEGWFVPAYMIHGDEARGIKPMAPDLKSVNDLPKYVDLFKEDANSSKARFLNCPEGWECEKANTQKMKAYKLAASYTNVRAADGTTFDAEILKAYQQGKPVVFYYWAPSPVLGKLNLVQLQEPAFNAACWNTIARNLTNYACGSATPSKSLSIGISIPFQNDAPELVTFLEKYSMPVDLVNRTLSDMMDRKLSGQMVAKEFMKKNKALWKQWVPADIALKIEKKL